MLSASNIDAALRECKAPDTFNHKEFLQTCGPFENTLSQVQELFQFLDDDRSGYIEEEELKNLLINFDPSARELTSETREFMAAADHDNDGRVGADGEFFLYQVCTKVAIKLQQNCNKKLYSM
uniref:Parvalbumin n=1 Tax=Pyxicephalus adspersus TaxID=30357 RepID=A0AAV2ZPJ8_PYXAD|nr:TPA: hypothetical protein GDO54_015976 [Pyxicephalus adspersus]